MILSKLRAYLPALISLLSFVFLCGLSVRSYLSQTADIKDQQVHIGIATIRILHSPQITNFGETLPEVWVCFHGALYEATYVTGFSRLRVGEKARITYCIGKSGQIYVIKASRL